MFTHLSRAQPACRLIDVTVKPYSATELVYYLNGRHVSFPLRTVKLFSIRSVCGAQKSTKCILLHLKKQAFYDTAISEEQKLLTTSALYMIDGLKVHWRVSWLLLDSHVCEILWNLYELKFKINKTRYDKYTASLGRQTLVYVNQFHCGNTEESLYWALHTLNAVFKKKYVPLLPLIIFTHGVLQNLSRC